MTRTTQNILVAVALLIPGCGDDGEEGSTTAAAATTAPASSSTSGGSEDASTAAEPPRADLGVEPPEVCDGYCSAAAGCLGVAETDCLLACNNDIEERAEISADCADAFEATRACAGELDCSDFADYDAAQGDYPCAAEDQDADLRCTLGDDPPAAVCEDFCSAAVGCGASEADACAVTCTETRAAAEETGPDCVVAQDDLLVCVGGLDCDAFTDWQDGAPDAACAQEGMAVAELCIGED